MFDDTFWSYRIAYKIPIGTTLFRLVYGKACHLPVEFEPIGQLRQGNKF